MEALKTNYQDDVLNTDVNTKRKYNMTSNSDGTVSFEDVTDYDTEGDTFGAADINSTNAAVMELYNSRSGKIYYGTADPNNATGENGDVYMKIIS